VSRVGPVTVVIPACDAAPFLQMALDSLKQQTVMPQEIVVVDDGSVDDTGAIAERNGALCLRQDRAGPGASRNRALAACKTEFVAFLDAEDWYALDKLERSLDYLHDLHAACLATDAWLVAGDRVEGRKNEGRVVPAVLTLELLLARNPIVCSTVVCRSEAVRSAGGFDESPDQVGTEDYDLWLRMAQREPIAWLAEPMTFYRAHADDPPGSDRWLRGVDRILDKVAASHDGEAHFQNLVKQRRSGVRLAFARELLWQGRRAEARAVLAEARRFANTWSGFFLWLRSLLPARGGAS
jgi:glycosyltransferase involved in cell wall biosynthesis